MADSTLANALSEAAQFGLTPVQAREAYAAGADVLELPPPAMTHIESFTVSAADGYAIPVRLVAPSTAVLPVLLYFHGGGYFFCGLDTHRP